MTDCKLEFDKSLSLIRQLVDARNNAGLLIDSLVSEAEAFLKKHGKDGKAPEFPQ